MTIKPATKNRLLESKFKLRRILEVTNAINENQRTRVLFDHFKAIIQEDLKIERAAFISFSNGEWSCAFTIGIDEQVCEYITELELAEFTDITSLSNHSNSQIRFFDLVIPVMQKEKQLGFLFLKDETEDNSISSIIKNLNYLQSMSNIIMVAIENKRLAKEQLEQEGLKRELKLAQRIQRALLPARLPDNQFISVTADHRSYGHVGGDYYDIIETQPGEYYFCIADISGKGVSAALLMSNFQAAFKATVRQSLPLNNIIKELNNIVLESSQGEKFITLFLGKYDGFTRELEYVNCAHPSALIFNDKMLRELKASIPGLGMLEELPPFRVNTYTLPADTILTCFTDGVTEIENEEGEQYGIENLKRAIRDYTPRRIEGFIEYLTEDVKTFVKSSPVTDDVAILNILFK